MDWNGMNSHQWQQHVQLLPQLQCKGISILHYVWKGPNQQAQHDATFSKKVFP